MPHNTHVYSVALYICTPLIFLIAILAPFLLKRIGYWQYTLLFILGYGYLVGKTCGILIVGPRFVRWYLADLSWVPLFASIPLLNDYVRRNLGQKSILSAHAFAKVACFAAVAQELVMLKIQNDNPAKHVGGDWIDVVCFVTMYVVTRYILNSLNRTFVAEDLAYEGMLLEEKRERRRAMKKARKRK